MLLHSFSLYLLASNGLKSWQPSDLSIHNNTNYYISSSVVNTQQSSMIFASRVFHFFVCCINIIDIHYILYTAIYS